MLSSGGYDPKESILICGGRRSGTTWLAQTIASIPDSAILFEPLHPRQVPGVSRAGFTWNTYVRPGTSWPEGERFLDEVFRGRTLNAWTGRLIPRPMRVTTWIVKCIRANRLLPWLAGRFPIRMPLLVVRHPCAVISSEIASGWRPHDALVDQALLEDFPQIADVLGKVESQDEHRALDWAINALVPLSHQKAGRYLTVPYEHLFRGESTFEPIFRKWQLPMPERLTSRLGVWSHTARDRDAGTDPRSALTDWTKQLRPEQVRQILAVTNALGLDFYGEDPEPDEARLARWLNPS